MASECSVDSTQMGRLTFTDQISYDYARACYVEEEGKSNGAV